MHLMPLLPHPRFLEPRPGRCRLAPETAVLFDPASPRDTVLLPLAERLREAASQAGFRLECGLELAREARVPDALASAPPVNTRRNRSPAAPAPCIRALSSADAPPHAEGYTLDITPRGVTLLYREPGGLRAGVATLRQLLREFGRTLPCLRLRDWPDFPRRGVMLDVSRGKVPTAETLMQFASDLADFKINELQLYTEHTFAYRNFEPVWRGWGPLTGEDILQLDAHCQRRGIDLVPNQNSFGHLRYWLEHPPLRPLAEVAAPYEGAGGEFLRYPTTLAPNHPGTLPFLRGLYDELLPHFRSECFNVGCDETWDLGRGQSQALCEARGKGRVYLDFLRQIHREVTARGKRMMFWGDIILHHPELIAEAPKDVIALNWGYEAEHPFDRETAAFAEAGLPFYVCPGTSTWMTLIGKHDNAFANLRAAADAGCRHGAGGYLNTDWGDGGHPQPLAVSWPLFVAGAALSWRAATYDDRLLARVLSRDVYRDSTGRVARAASALGLAHRQFAYREPNVTPFGAVLAAPPPEWRELVCRNGLKHYARIAPRNVRAALAEVERQRAVLAGAKPVGDAATLLAEELDFAARMAVESCHFMLWQQALAAGRRPEAARLARRGARELAALDREFRAWWPRRNKGTTEKCSAFLGWRIADYRRGRLHFPPDQARLPKA